jgi:DNA-binding LacI/PurR family transcriptional regulator
VATPVTIYDVAAEAGVSISTVSLALNSPTRVSDATRQRVLRAADALGFVPKADAVSRARRGVGRIGVVAPFTSYASFARRLNGVLRAVQGQPLEVVVFDQQSAAATALPLLAALPLTRRLDGLVVMGLPLDESVAARLVSLELPTVLVDLRHPSFDSVHADDTAGGRMVADHLLERGHRRFAFLGETQQSHLYVSPSEQRLAGYRAGLQAAGHTLSDDDVRLTGHQPELARQAAAELLSQPDHPTAVFAHDDTLAAGVLWAARDLGLSVPRDVAVVGFDDSDVAEVLDLSTVRQPLEESGRTAAELLLERLHRTPRSTREVTLRLELLVRGTS